MRADGKLATRARAPKCECVACMLIACTDMNTEATGRGAFMHERLRSTPPIAAVAARTAGRNIERLARSAVPALADFVVVFMVTGRWIVGVASAHSSPHGRR